MAATAIATTTQFAHYGKSKVYYVASIADISAPTRIELDAGTDLSGEIRATGEWKITAGEITTETLGDDFVSSIAGRLTAEGTMITFRASEDGVDARDVLAVAATGNIVILYGGDVESNKMTVFPVRVKDHGIPLSVDETLATVDIAFSVTAKPQEGLAVPAAA